MEIINSRGSMWRKWDLHLHSNASDGKCTPQELVEEAVKKGISVIALTDHHTVNNIDAIKKLGNDKDIRVISGIEFRTEYGQKSVHIIGLFPDEYNGMVLNQETLYEQILCPLNLSRSSIIQAARVDAATKGKTIADDDVAYKHGLLLVQVDFKRAADLIHKNGGLVTVHAGGKSNSLDEEMKHEGTSPKNVSELADSLGPVKEELLRNYVDICEVKSSKESQFYLKQFSKPSIAASDAHDISQFSRNYVWIKAEPTFEGLRQILFEPESRVRIQVEQPEEKSDYLVIDSIQVDHSDFGKQTIPFNQGLNTIIGGRSSGKSVLLGCIARLCGDNTPIKKNKPEYSAYIGQITRKMSIKWRDQTDVGRRKVDYFPQSYIIDLASDKKEISQLAVRILRTNTDFGNKIDVLKDSLLTNTGAIHTMFAQYQSLREEISGLETELLALGNKDGIKKEIAKIQEQIDTIKLSMSESLSDDEEVLVEQQKQQIADYNEILECALSNVEALSAIRDLQLMKDISDELLDLDERIRKSVEGIYNAICLSAHESWNKGVSELVSEQEQIASECSSKICKIEADPIYRKAKALYSKNQEYVACSNRFSIEKRRYDSILRKEAEIGDREKRLSDVRKQLMHLHTRFYDMYSEFCNSVNMERDNIRIYPYVEFKQDEFFRMVNEAFDGRPSSNQKVLLYRMKDAGKYTSFISDVIDNLYAGEYTLKKNVTVDEIVERLVSFNGFTIQYNVQYQGDDLSSMSEGKTAFVILRMLLDFSENDYPILIDQPEDDLDNRAIYAELVQYLRKKKIQRQIILVTHNPNIVVGADAEEIIVANQHGVNCPNPDGKKFVYRTGALEESFKNNKECTLLRQGIREHVCDILEGGNDAFRIRENKYQL